MINIQTYKVNQKNILLSEINANDSILIIGNGTNENKLNELYKPKNFKDMITNYGKDSDLTNAYLECSLYGGQNIFVINCYKTTDYIDIIDYIKYYNFSYVVPINIKLSDTFYDETYNRNIYFAEHYVNEFSKYTNSLIIFTDEHASLYENIDDFIRDMNEKIINFKTEVYYLLQPYGRNIAFCANNIKDRQYANVVLAAMLASSTLGLYPNNISESAVFDIDPFDIQIKEFIYFKNNILVGTSVENLNSFRTNNDSNKVIIIDLVVKYLERNLDMNFVVGKQYNQFMEMEIKEYLDNFLRKMLNSSIKNYCIRNVNFVKTKEMCGYIIVNLDIWPINSLENINISLEV